MWLSQIRPLWVIVPREIAPREMAPRQDTRFGKSAFEQPESCLRLYALLPSRLTDGL